MFGSLRKSGTDSNCEYLPEEETFLQKSDTIGQDTASSSLWTDYGWKLSTFFFACTTVLTILFPRHNSQVIDSYETGFGTDLEPAKSSIQMQRMHFSGGIVVNDSSLFELVMDHQAPQYVGHPSKDLDDAWDTLVGGYIALDKAEADQIHGEISFDGGSYFVVPHVRHSLHCVNYLRKVAYEKWYPTIRHEDKPTVPTFWQHVDHCVDTLRQTVQCHSDLTPVPHIWSEGKQMYLADTSLEHTCRNYESLMKWQDAREEAFKSGHS